VLEILDISNNQLDETWSEEIANALWQNNVMKHLNMSKNDVGVQCAKILADGIISNGALETLDISDNQLNGAYQVSPGMDVLENALIANTSITELNLAGNVLDESEGVEKVIHILRNNNSLVNLNIDHNHIPEKKMKDIIRICKEKSMMKVLCEVPFTDINTQELDISGKSIGREGTFVLSDYLMNNKTLTSLNMRNNKINFDDMNDAASASGKALADALSVNTVLKTLDLSNNYLTPPFAKAFAVGLGTNKALEKLIMAKNKIATSEIGKAFAEALATNRTLKELDLSANAIPNENYTSPMFAQELAVGIKDNTVLTSLDISINNIGYIAPELDAGWEERFRELVIGFDEDKDGILNEDEFGKFLEALGAGAHDIDYYTHYYCYDAPEASDNFLQDGNMTVEGLVSFYKNVLKTRAKTVVDNLEKLKVLPQKKAIGIIALANAIKTNRTLRSIDMSVNHITEEGGKEIVSALEGNTVVTKLDISNNDEIDEPTRQRIEQLLERNQNPSRGGALLPKRWSQRGNRLHKKSRQRRHSKRRKSTTSQVSLRKRGAQNAYKVRRVSRHKNRHVQSTHRRAENY
jgi:Ran GTPase-activating protein (RanGAP) involved in mRNA processing and transport